MEVTKEKTGTRTGRQSALEQIIDQYLSNTIHLFLSVPALLILLLAIAAELSLRLLYHRTSAAIEVVIFVVARKMVTPGITGLELLLGAAALAGLIITRFYYVAGHGPIKPTTRLANRRIARNSQFSLSVPRSVA